MEQNKFLRTKNTINNSTEYVDEIKISDFVFVIHKFSNKKRQHYIVFFKGDELGNEWECLTVVTEVIVDKNRAWWMGIKPSKQHRCLEGLDADIEKQLKTLLITKRKNDILSLID